MENLENLTKEQLIALIGELRIASKRERFISSLLTLGAVRETTQMLCDSYWEDHPDATEAEIAIDYPGATKDMVEAIVSKIETFVKLAANSEGFDIQEELDKV